MRTSVYSVENKIPLPLKRFTGFKGEFECRHFLIFCDGAVRPSPFGWAGIGYAIFTDDGRFIEAHGFESKNSQRIGINKTEIWAAIKSLYHIMMRFDRNGIALHTDSAFLFGLSKGKIKPQRNDVIKLFESFCRVRDEHIWVSVNKVNRQHPRMRLPDRYAKEGAAHAKRRALEKYSGPRWERVFTRNLIRGYDETQSKLIDIA